MNENQVSRVVLDAAFKIHTALGAGLLEKAYEECLCYELAKSGLYIERQKPMPLIYETVKMDCGYRLDILVEEKVIIEVKSVVCFTEAHIAQTLTYMRLADVSLGLLLNFKEAHLRNGIKRLTRAIQN